MDPNKRSMEEGKEFLNLCGNPQRDIDLMTEKWVVVASVEALIRYPLVPGEDPTARCLSKKNSQPAVSQRHRIPQNNEDQEKRENNKPSLKDFDKKPHVTKVMTRHCIQTPSERPTGDKIQKINCFGTVRKRTKPEEEKETTAPCHQLSLVDLNLPEWTKFYLNTCSSPWIFLSAIFNVRRHTMLATVKSKKCCSFAHTSRSKMCLIKHWHEALPVQPLGSNNEKEMMKPMEVKQYQSPEIFKMTEDKDKERQMQEVLQTKTLLKVSSRRSSKKKLSSEEETEETCFFLRKPTSPSISYMTKKKKTSGSCLQ